MEQFLYTHEFDDNDNLETAADILQYVEPDIINPNEGHAFLTRFLYKEHEEQVVNFDPQADRFFFSELLKAGNLL